MASKATVGSLRVVLGLDSAQFTAGLTKAQMGLQKFGSLAKTGALAIGAAMVAAGGATAMAMKGVIDEADKMSKLSASLGIPIDELSKMRYAAEMADVSIDDLAKGVKRLAAGMLDSTESATGPAARAFAMLGVSVKDSAGKLRPMSDVMADLAGKFQQLENGPAKTALAMRLFGKSGADMIPLLNEGSDGLRAMYEEAEELGIVLDTQTGKAAEAFNDNLTRLGKVKDGIVTKITAHMLPAMAGLTDAMVVAAKNSKLMEAAGQTLGWVLKALATAAVTAGGFFYALAQDIAMAATVAANWSTNPAKAVVAIAAGNARRENTLATIKEINTAIWRPQTGGLDAPPAVEGMELVEAAAGGARNATERLTDAQREAQRAADEMARDAARVFDQTRSPAELYAAEVERLTRFLNAAAISQDTFNRAMLQAKEQFERDDPASQAARALEEKKRQFAIDAANERMAIARDHREELEAATYDGIRGGLEAAADGNLGKYLAMRIRSALMDNLAGSLTDMLLGDPKKGSGSGLFGSLGSWGSSLKSVFNMFRGGFPGFATGGSFKVGGAPGKDKNFVGMNLTKGEMVDIRRPGQDMAGGGLSVHVAPSPFFDVAVERVARPVAEQASAQMGRTVLAASRRSAPGMQQQQRRLGTT